MEYLMTYGWAILIIAVVLAVLFQLGVFSGGNFLPHAQPGSCQVSRTAAGVSLEGQCNGMLPEFVAQFNGQGNEYVLVPYSTTLAATGSWSVAFWFSSVLPSTNAFDVELISSRVPTDGTLDIQLVGGASPKLHGDIGVGGGTNGWLTSGANYAFAFGSNTWYHVIYTISPTGYTIYVNGANAASGSWSANTPSLLDSSNPLCIGGNGGSCESAASVMYNGQISDVQVYNTTLSASEVQALYLEGIGGAPIRPQNIVGWWPLNGNANDYSGNGNNGQLNGVTFSSSWESSYAAP